MYLYTTLPNFLLRTGERLHDRQVGISTPVLPTVL